MEAIVCCCWPLSYGIERIARYGNRLLHNSDTCAYVWDIASYSDGRYHIGYGIDELERDAK